MCGGIVVSFGKIPKKDLREFFTDREIAKFEQKGKFESYYWNKRPVLPVTFQNQTKLYDWGNRDEKLPFPKTGWAKEESLEKGKWDWLKPKKVKIPAERGYEKGVWFDFPLGTEGVVVEKDQKQRVYMITQSADDKYLAQTGHNRMPVGKKSNFVRVKSLTK